MGQHPLMQRIGKGFGFGLPDSRRISGGRSLVSARSRRVHRCIPRPWPPIRSCWPRAGHRTCAAGHTADFGNAVAEPGLVASVIITDQLARQSPVNCLGVFACTAGCEVVIAAFRSANGVQ